MSAPSPTTALAPRLLVGAITAAAVVALGLEGGGYDVVPRQTAAVVIWWAILLGALLLRRDLPKPTLPLSLATAALAGLALWAAATIGGSLSTERSAIEIARWTAYLAPLMLVGWILPRNQWRSVVAGATVGAVTICLLALGDRLSPGLLSDTRTVVFLNTRTRIAEPLDYWNALGSWGVMTSLLLLSIGSHARSAVVRGTALLSVPAIGVVIYLTSSRSSLLAAVVGIAVLVALARNRWTLILQLLAAAAAIGLSIATTDGQPQIALATGDAGAGTVLLAVVGSGLALAAVGALTAVFGADRLRVPAHHAKIATIVGGIAAVLVVAALGVSKGGDAWDRFSTVEDQTVTGSQSRLTMLNNGNRVEQWRVALDAWKEDRWTGQGAGTFELIYNREGSDSQFVRDAHSAPLETLAEQGLVGLALLLTFMGSALTLGYLAVRRAADEWDRGIAAGATGAVGAFLVGSCFDWFWEVGALAMLAITLVAALGAAAAVRATGDAPSDASAPVDESTPASPAGRRRAPWVLTIGLVTVAVVALLVQLPGLVGTSEIRRSQEAVRAGDFTEARDRADRAIDTMPWASSPFLQRALVDEQAGELEPAIQSLKLAARRDPYDWRIPLVMARVQARADNPRAALAAYRQAKSLRPYGQFFPGG